MNRGNLPMTDPERTGFEEKVAFLLRTGVGLAGAVVLLGGIGYVIQSAGESPEYHVFHRTPAVYSNLFRVIAAAVSGDYRAVIQTGLMMLIATPVVRVAFSAFAFAREHDRTYVALTIAVLAILLLSLFHASW